MILVVALCAALLPGLAQASAFESAMRDGESAWSSRSEGHVGARAAREPIERSIGAFQRAVDAEPDNLDAHLALLRGLWFRAEYTTANRNEAQRAFTDGRRAHARAFDVLAAKVGGPRALVGMTPQQIGERYRGDAQAAGVFFWGAVHWGFWAEVYGHVRAGRGAGDRLHYYSSALMAIDPGYDGGRGYQVLGRVHARAPRVPFVTSWVDRRLALRALERAVEVNPSDRTSQLFLAEALLVYVPERREDAVKRLRELASTPPRDELVVEDLASKRDAEAMLARLGLAHLGRPGRSSTP